MSNKVKRPTYVHSIFVCCLNLAAAAFDQVRFVVRKLWQFPHIMEHTHTKKETSYSNGNKL